jgi:predicted O-methyltransferase YrrM
MNRLPEVKSNCGRITNLFYNAVASRLLITAIHLNVFDHLEEPVTAGEVASALGSYTCNTVQMLDALCACGLIKKNRKKYKNTTEAGELLVTGKPAYLGDWLKLADEDCRVCLEKLTELILNGPGVLPQKKDMNSEAYCERFTASHAASSLAGIARDMAREIAAIPGFIDCRRMLDLGGGPGINAMAVVETHDQLVATVFDRPDVIKFTGRYIREYGFDERVTVVAGDYLKDSIGSGYDFIMITDSLYYTDPEIDSVLNKCCAALNPGGFLVGIHAVLTHARTQPAFMVLGMLPDALSEQGVLPDKGFLERALSRCGFENISSRMISVGGSPMEMNIGYVK